MNHSVESSMEHAQNALELRDVTKRFQKKRGDYTYALKGVSLTLKRGEVVGILGPNGSGKSTLVRVISTLTVPDTGTVQIFGVDAVAHPKIVQRYINRVSVEASFFKKMSSMENLLFGAKLYGITDKESRPRIMEILRSIGFDVKRVGEPMEHLSRGTQQKIALARALLTSPMLMLLDEPTTGLDPRSKRDVQELIWKIRASHDSTILLCTHDMGEAEELCDRIGILVDGNLIALDTPLGLKQQYQQGDELPTLEEVFMLATGLSLDDAISEKDGDGDESAPTIELERIARGLIETMSSLHAPIQTIELETRAGRHLGLCAAQLFSDPALLPVGGGLAGLFDHERADDRVHRGLGRQHRRGNRARHHLPADRHADLELPLHDLRHPVGNGELGALGRDDRIHLHESGQPRVAADRDGDLRGCLRHPAHDHHAGGDLVVLRAVDGQRELSRRAGAAGDLQHLAGRLRDDGGDHAAHLTGEGPAGDLYLLGGAAA